jgi:hypothetical protein
MSRDISSGMLTPLLNNQIVPCFMAAITFLSTTVYAWTGVGTLIYAGNDYIGIGSFGRISAVTEGTDIQAYGMTVELSGIDPLILAETMGDVQQGAPATIYFALLSPVTGAIEGTPYPIFVGTVDKPTLSMGVPTISISLALESRMADLQRASLRRYTSADQQGIGGYPTDTAMNWIESLNDASIKWNG